MAYKKKSEWLNEALELNLNVSDDNTIAEIKSAIKGLSPEPEPEPEPEQSEEEESKAKPKPVSRDEIIKERDKKHLCLVRLWKTDHSTSNDIRKLFEYDEKLYIGKATVKRTYLDKNGIVRYITEDNETFIAMG